MFYLTLLLLILFLLLLLLIVIILLWLLPYRARLVLILSSSLIFYCFWKISCIPVLLISVIVDWWVSQKMLKWDKQNRFFLLLCRLTTNLGLLIYFKYLFFFSNSSISPNYKLFVVTGFCGALTTFSTFSVEIVALLQASKFEYAISTIAIHVIGSLIFTVLGILSYQFFTNH